jgi:hypothetical protein
MTDSTTWFDDPALKTAVRLIWRNKRAPATLIQRVRGALAAAAGLAVAATNSSGSSSPARRADARGAAPARLAPLGTAAVILLALGSVFCAVAFNSAPASFPGQWASALVATHDTCSAMPDHHFVIGVAPNDIPRASDRLANQLGFPVLSMSAVNGWQFRGAAQCRVGPEHCAHLLYRDGDTTLSVFSLPVPALSGDWSGLESEVGGHQLAGFVRGNTLYCVVEYNPGRSPTPAAVRSLIDQLQDQFVNPAPIGSGAMARIGGDRASGTAPISLDMVGTPGDVVSNVAP